MKNSEALRKEQNDLALQAQEIIRGVQDRDFTPEEDANVKGLLDRAEAMNSSISNAERLEALAPVSKLVAANAPETFNVINRAVGMTAGEYLAGYFDAAVNPRNGGMHAFLDRAEAAGVIDRAPAQQGTADNPAIVPETIVSGLINMLDASRPVWNSFSTMPMSEQGDTITRARITQHVAVGEQANEFDQLATRKFAIATHSVNKRTFGGVLELSKQNIRWTDPKALQVVVNDFLDMYAIETEEAAIAYLDAAATNTSSYDISTISAAVGTFVAAAKKVKRQCKRAADTVWIDLDTWATLASLVNANNDASGLSVVSDVLSRFSPGLNLQFVPFDTAFEAATPNSSYVPTVIVGASSYIWKAEQPYGLLQAEVPSTLSTQIAYAADLAFDHRAEGLVKLA